MFEALREYLRPFYLRNIYFPLFPGKKPAYFDTCWNFPCVEARAGAALPTVLFLPMNDWHARIQRTQHLALALSRRGYRCIYLSPHLGREFPARPNLANSTCITQLQPNLFELHVHLPREPVFHHRLLSAVETSLLARQIRNVLAGFGAAPTVQIVSLPVWLPAAQALKQTNRALMVYDCHDFLPGFQGIAPEIIQKEPDLFRSSDVVICSSQALMDRAERFGVPRAKCRLLRNAAAPELLETTRIPNASVRIGYIGALEAWFDVAVVRAAALAHPEWQFEFYGRVENENVKTLAKIPNIHLHGEIPFSRLPEVLATFSVAIIPFKLNPLILATDPIKVYEYLAAGLPIVAANLPELVRFGDAVARYIDPADFTNKLEEAIRTDSAASARERREIALRETWESRAGELDSQIQFLLRSP